MAVNLAFYSNNNAEINLRSYSIRQSLCISLRSERDKNGLRFIRSRPRRFNRPQMYTQEHMQN